MTACKHGVYGICKTCNPKLWKKLMKHTARKLTEKEKELFRNFGNRKKK